jgi:myxalamid-type polyketide synthase MxaE and MxaD
LRGGESDLALAGCDNRFLSADDTAVHTCGMPLSPACRSKTFDAGANGYARGAGCGVVVLKRLADAEADSDRVWVIIRGSAVNQDGRTHGVAAPNGTAQRAVIRQALANAKVPPASIGYVEAHGTGTELGDPIEAEALAEVYGEGRGAGQRAMLGAIKTNIGHLEAAAGVAGLIKAVLVLDREAVPKNLHFARLNPHIALDESRFCIADERCPWPRDLASPRRAAVSSFGAGGTNAHVILEEAPVAMSRVNTPGEAAPDESAVRPFVLALSADRPGALRAAAAAWSAFLDAEGDDRALRDACFTAAVRRDQLAHRAVVVASDRRTLRQRLDALARDEPDAGVVSGRAAGGMSSTRGLVFAFAGMGAHGVDQGRDLLAHEPAFRQAFEAVDQAIRRQAGWSPIDVLQDDHCNPSIDLAQPTFFALQIGLAALWRAWGVVPDAVVGHSLGEVAAARVAGALSLDDAVRVVLARSQQLATIAGDGAMALVGLAEEEAAALAAEHARAHGAALAVAVVMGHQASVLSGPREDVERVVERMRARNVFSRRVDVDVAFHSPQVVPLADALGAQLAGLTPQTARIPFCSTVTGDLVDGATLDADYWARNLRQPVRFWPALRTLAAKRHDVFLELGGHPVLLPAIRQDFEHAGQAVVTLPSLLRDEKDRETLLRSFGGLHSVGRSVDWRAVVGQGRMVTVPGYPWQRQGFWFDGSGGARAATTPAPVGMVSGQASNAASPQGGGAARETLGGALVEEASRPGGPRGELARRLAATMAFQRRDVLLGHLLDEVASVLGLEGDDADLEPSQGFFQLGMDSRMAVELTERLARDLDLPLPSTLTFEHPASDVLCDELERLAADGMARAMDHDVAPDVAPDREPIGVGPWEQENDDLASDDVVTLLRDQIAAMETESLR